MSFQRDDLEMGPLAELVQRARTGDVDAFGRLVAATQAMAYGIARSILRDADLSQDAVQEAYLVAFRRLADLDEPVAFAGWFRRIVVTTSLNVRRARRRSWLCLDDAPDVPVLDDAETSWSAEQRHRLARALVRLSPDDRRLCDRRYHGRWSTARLAREAGIDEAAMRKRLQRVRDRLRKEIEMVEQQGVPRGELGDDMPARIVELLTRPRLTDLPENPVGRVLEDLRSVYADFDAIDLPEVVDFEAARTAVGSAVYVGDAELHRVDGRRILRYDLTLPLLQTVRFDGRPLRLWSAGKAYRVCQADAMHLEAFHQAEVFYMDERERLDPWQMTARVLQSVDRLLPGRTVKIVPTPYGMCRQSWELEVETDGRWYEVLAWGVFIDEIVTHLGGDPARHAAMGVGCGLERLAMLRYGVDDIRKIETSRVA